MARKFIATILAAALAVSSFTAPAQAGSKDKIAPIIAGAAALAIIGTVIADKNKKRVQPVVPTPQQVHGSHGGQAPRFGPRHGFVPPGVGNGRPGYRDHGRGHGREHGRTQVITMPQSCRIVMPSRQGPISGYGYRCVQRNARFADQLPGRCVAASRSNQGPRFFYDSGCLRRAGIRAF